MLHIESWLEPQGWRPIPMDMPLVRQSHCPCCEASLEPVVTMSGTVGPSIEVGACPRCGYVGYIDRPTEQWFNDFYASDWDAKGKALAAIADAAVQSRIEVKEKALHPATGMIQRANVPKDSTILEVGAGFGWAARCVQRALEYPNVVAVEPCEHRAKFIRDVFRLPVVPEIQPANLIYSWHVLEHVYDPAAWVAKCAAVQQPGDTLCISVPNQVGEPTMGVLLFLPHLHSFTMLSLTELLGRHGYVVADRVLSSCANLEVIARKLPDGQVPRMRGVNICGERRFFQKLHDGTAAECDVPNDPVLYWQKYGDIPETCRLDQWEEKRQGLHEPRAMICRVEDGHGLRPLRLKFNGPVELCVK